MSQAGLYPDAAGQRPSSASRTAAPIVRNGSRSSAERQARKPVQLRRRPVIVGGHVGLEGFLLRRHSARGT